MKQNKLNLNIKKRACALLLCLFLSAACVVSPLASLPPARASAAASADAAVEAAMALYSFLEACGIAGGVEAGLDSYGSGKDLLDSFLDFLSMSTAMVPMPGTGDDYYDKDQMISNYEKYMGGTSITLSDGTVVTSEELYEMFVEGSNALKEEDFVRFRIIEGGGGSGEPDPEKNPFSRLQKIVLGAGSAALVSDFYEKLYSGGIEGLDPADYYGQMYDGAYQRDGDGNYLVNGRIVNADNRQFGEGTSDITTLAGSVPFRPAIYFEADAAGNRWMHAIFYNENTGRPQKYWNEFDGLESMCWERSVRGVNGSYSGSRGYGFSFLRDGRKDFTGYYFNIPVFSDYGTAAAFVSGGEAADASGMLNLRPYLIPALAGSIAEAAVPLLSTQLDPSVLPSAAAAAAAAVQALPEPAPGSDPEADTEAYRQAVADAVAEAAPASGGEKDPASGPEAAKKYRRDLSLIFPFCLPFDLVHFFEVMNAEPVAPCFHVPVKFEPLNIDMDIELDMAFMEPAMAVFRIGELGLFVIGLIMATSRLIRW